MPPFATLWQGNYAPTQISHSRRTTPARHLNLRHSKWLHPSGGFFVNTTKCLVVMSFKLCQEGNKQPLIQQTVFANVFLNRNERIQMRHSFARESVGGSRMCLTHT
jgi:hypothetical protein